MCIYMLREQRFTSRSMVVCRDGGVPYWPCGGGKWCGCRGCSCCPALNCWWWRDGWWSPPRVCLLGSSLERPPPPEEPRLPEPPPPAPTPTPKTPPLPTLPPPALPARLPGVSSFEPGSTSPLTDPPEIRNVSSLRYRYWRSSDRDNQIFNNNLAFFAIYIGASYE